jgi:hypothetical protein
MIYRVLGIFSFHVFPNQAMHEVQLSVYHRLQRAASVWPSHDRSGKSVAVAHSIYENTTLLVVDE